MLLSVISGGKSLQHVSLKQLIRLMRLLQSKTANYEVGMRCIKCNLFKNFMKTYLTWSNQLLRLNKIYELRDFIS